ncbi:hypothetical protein BDP27DRAFT_1317922 [Rhodocollybia butyracea]|uniref:Uncharacterized protein n=1 Tax=Rhodocollybia butyracea TaxID=206335 RepID=A0A9P5Q3J9_9AGAR|nr:hypothetical protein BDP27DRAFT_1317922 [Rhodocollybia butyracea]
MLSPDDPFNYTSRHWPCLICIVIWAYPASTFNNDLRIAERKRRLPTQSAGPSCQDIDTFVKLAEGGFNRTSLSSCVAASQYSMVTRILYPSSMLC